MPQRPHRDALATNVGAPQPPVSEATLLERLRAGDEMAFEGLFKGCYRSLCDFVRGYVRSRHTAEELVQTVFLRVWEKRETLTPAAGIRAYLFAACRNSALDYLRHEQIVERSIGPGRASQSAELEASSGTRSPSPDAAVQASELADAVLRAVQELPERRRSVVILRWQHQLTNTEIARTLGISVKGVEAHVSRALATLRERLGPFRP